MVLGSIRLGLLNYFDGGFKGLNSSFSVKQFCPFIESDLFLKQTAWLVASSASGGAYPEMETLHRTQLNRPVLLLKKRQ